MTDPAIPQSPFLPGTKIQFAYIHELADWLLECSTEVGECRICHLAPNAKGYSSVSIGRAIKLRAHRVVFFSKREYVCDDIMVLHFCDVRNCIEPKHLFKGTAQDNTDDMIAKGRKKSDPEVGRRRRKLTWLVIKPLYEQGLDRYEIAKRIGASPSTVWNYISAKGSYSAISVSSGDEDAVCVG